MNEQSLKRSEELNESLKNEMMAKGWHIRKMAMDDYWWKYCNWICICTK